MLAGRELGRWTAIGTALCLSACANGRQVYQTSQGAQTSQDTRFAAAEATTSDDSVISMSGREAGSDQILQLSGNVVLPVYRLDDGLGLDLKVALAGAQVQASLAAPALLGGPPSLPVEPGATDPGAVGALQSQTAAARVAANAAIVTPGLAAPGLASPGLAAPGLATPGLTAPTSLAAIDLGGALGSAAPPAGLAAGATVSGAVAGAINPINAAVASLPKPVGR